MSVQMIFRRVQNFYIKEIKELLYKSFSLNGTVYGFIDMVLVIIEGVNRDMAMKGCHWRNIDKMPDPYLCSVQRRVKEASGILFSKIWI